VSYEAKQLTHSAYERLRRGMDSESEEGDLEELQRELTNSIPVPPDAEDIKEETWQTR
jgi:hypothetical protein